MNMLMPKRTKYRRVHRGDVKGMAGRGTHVCFGEWGLKALESGWLSNREIEAARVAITRKMRRGGKIWIRVFPHRSITKKPAETRMGKGKGAPDSWVAPVRAGKIMFEVAGVSEDIAREALRLASYKLNIKCKPVGRHVLGGE